MKHEEITFPCEFIFVFTPYIIGVVWLKNVGGWKLVTSLGQRLDIGMSAGMDTENVVNIFSSYFPVIFL